MLTPAGLSLTGFYTALIALVFVAGEVVAGRREDDDGLDLPTRLRRRSEHVPFALLLLFVLELGGTAPWLLHGMGATLLTARIAAPLASLARLPATRFERGGAYATTAVTCAAAFLILFQALAPAAST